MTESRARNAIFWWTTLRNRCQRHAWLTTVADSAATFVNGDRDGEEDDEGSTVDKGRCAHPKDARAREDKDDGDRAQTQAKLGSDLSAGKETRCHTGWRPEEKGSVIDRPNQNPSVASVPLRD